MSVSQIQPENQVHLPEKLKMLRKKERKKLKKRKKKDLELKDLFQLTCFTITSEDLN
jgi:hypothetical protein